MTDVLIDARSLAEDKTGGVARVAKLWIEKKITENPEVHFVAVTTGWKPSWKVAKLCEDWKIEYRHLKIPNKIWSILCFLRLTSLDEAAGKKLETYERVLLPNIGFVGNLKTSYEILVHDLSFIIEPGWFSWKQRLWHKAVKAGESIKAAAKIECVSETTKRDAIKLLKIEERKIFVFKFDPTAMLEIAQRPSWLPSIVKRFVLILGGADKRKNAATALKAVAHYNMAHPQDYLVPVVLGGRVRQVGMRVAALEIENTIDDGDLGYLYKNAIVLLYPSWYEGFGLPLHEAHQFGTPVIASSAGALPETAPEGTIFCNPTKVNEWVGAMEDLVTGHE